MKKNNVRRIQFCIKFFILLLITYYAVIHQIKGVMGAPSIHTFCPFGGLESLFKLLTSGSYIKKIFPASMVLLFSTIVLAIFFHRGFCGWICPLGTLQELFSKIGRFFKIKQNPLPENIDKYLKYLKYVILLVIIYFTWKTGELVFNEYDPWAAYAHIPAGFDELFGEFLFGSIFLIMALFGSIWIPQNWCKYFCPMGAFLAICARVNFSAINRDKEKCINCGKCTKVCPVSIEVAKLDKISTVECYQCGDCINICPVENTLNYKIFNSKKISWLTYGIIAILIFFGSIYVSKALNIWRSDFKSISALLTDSYGMKSPYLIKGSLTLDDLAKEFNIPIAYLKEKLKMPSGAKTNVFIKKIAKKHSFEVNDVRVLILTYLQKKYPKRVYKRPLTGEGSKDH